MSEPTKAEVVADRARIEAHVLRLENLLEERTTALRVALGENISVWQGSGVDAWKKVLDNVTALRARAARATERAQFLDEWLTVERGRVDAALRTPGSAE